MVTPDEFRARAVDCRGDEYEYDMTTFTGMKAPMRMICSTHGSSGRGRRTISLCLPDAHRVLCRYRKVRTRSQGGLQTLV